MSGDLDNEVGFWLKSRPYIWVQGYNLQTCMRLYLYYSTERVFIYSRQGFPEGQRSIELKDYRYIPDKEDRDYKKISALNLWNPKSDIGNALQPCSWAINYFQIYVPQRDNSRIISGLGASEIPFDILQIRIEGEPIHINYKDNLRKGEILAQNNGIFKGSKNFDVYSAIMAYLITAGVSPFYKKPDIIPPRWYKGDPNNLRAGIILDNLRNLKKGFDDVDILNEIIATNDPEYVPVVKYMIEEKGLVFLNIAIADSVARNNIQVFEMIIDNFKLPPYVLGATQEITKNEPQFKKILEHEYPPSL